MDLSGIISISGMPGLYKVVAQSKNGIIVESLTDKRRFPAYSTQKISSLQDISIYTEGESAPLKDILTKIRDKHSSGVAIDHKENDAAVTKYFAEILPDYDKEKVHVSDMRKVINWYNMLQKSDLLKDVPVDKDGEKIEIPGAPSDEKKIKVAAKPQSSTPKASTKGTGKNTRTATVRKSGAA